MDGAHTSGSVAAVKAPDLADALLQRGVSVDLVVTAAAFSLLQATYRDTVPWARLTAARCRWCRMWRRSWCLLEKHSGLKNGGPAVSRRL